MSDDEIIEVLKEVELLADKDKAVFRMSKGMQQRLAFAKAILNKPEILFLDEPTTGLDPVTTGYIHNMIKKLAEKGTTIILTTHNPLAIAELVKEQVQILYREAGSRTVRAENPAVDPKGMGFAGIVTSDMFGLGTSLDKATNDDLMILHQLSTQQQPLNEAERSKLADIRQRLEGLDFNFASRDRLEQEYLRARFDLATDGVVDGAVITPENKQQALDVLVQSLLRSLKDGQS